MKAEIKKLRNKETYIKAKKQKEERLRLYKGLLKVENLPYKNFIETLNDWQLERLLTFLVCEPRNKDALLNELKNIHEVYTMIAEQKL